jgi:hypothetical protein
LLPLASRYGPGGKALALLLIVRSDLSHRVVVELWTAFGSVGVNVADQEIIVLDV